MKIEKKSKKSVGELPVTTQDLIRRILGNSVEEVVSEIRKVTVWRYGKCELYHWIDVLDMFDYILAIVTLGYDSHKGFFMCERLTDPKVKSQVLSVLNFTALLIEHSYARHIYNSTEHLCVLLASPDLDIVLAVLNLLYVFGKRSNFISRLPAQQRNNLNSYLEFLGETWGGDKNGFGLARCCQDISLEGFPPTATSVYFEYQPLDEESVLDESSGYRSKSVVINNVDKLPESVSELMTKLTQEHSIPPVQMMRLMTRLRLAKNFGSRAHRIQCVLVRLQAISVLVYSMAPAEVVDPLIYDGLVEELVEVLEMKDCAIQEVRAAVLRTLTAIIHLERDPRLGVIIEVTGASTYHGFLPTLVRDCVAAITSAGPDGISPNHPLSFATALFSFLYHLATYEASGDALVNSGVMESLLQVLEWRAIQPMNITLVTRAVRVVDLITNLDMTAFHSLGGWDKMLERLKMEVEECKGDVPTILPSTVKPASSSSFPVPMETDAPPTTSVAGGVSLEGNEVDVKKDGSEIIQCMPERSALIKSILNFLKKAIPDPTFAENIRNFVNSSLPSSLAHIASNAEYYGASIYLPATEVATTFIFHDPSQLSHLQDNGLPWIVLNSLINKKIPVTREVLSALPNILSALCLNSRGLQAFIEAEPFDHLFGVLISIDYLPAMRRKRGNETLGDTASNLGGAMDELMRHQPLLRTSVMSALIRLLKKLCSMGSTPVHLGEDDPNLRTNQGGTLKSPAPIEEAMISEDDEEDDRESHVSDEKEEEEEDVTSKGGKKKNAPLPLTEYTQNVVHFVDCILSTSSSDDHIKDFVSAGGLPPLISLLSLPALPLNFPSSAACNSVISACKAVLHCAHESKVLEEGLSQLSQVLTNLQPFINSPVEAKGSILLNDLASCPAPDQSRLLHNLTAAGSYIQLFIQLAKCIPIESKQICVKNWSSPLGHKVLDQLSDLYRALVWEGFIVLAKASEKESKKKETETEKPSDHTPNSTPKAIPVSVISQSKNSMEEESKTLVQTLKSFTPPLAVTSRVGRSLAELMSLLVRICSGPLHRPPRRGPGSTNSTYHPLSEDAISVCTKLTNLLVNSLTWDVPTPSEIDDINDPDMREWLFSGMTFKMYAVDFCLLLLFDEHKQAFHMMLHCFNEKKVLDALIKSFHAAIDSIKEVRDESNIFADYAVTSDFLEAWLNLAERLIDTSSILDSAHSLPIPPPSQTGGKKLTHNPMFNPVEFIVNAQKAIFPCVCKLWPPENVRWVMPEVAEHLMSTTKHFYSCEKVIQIKLAELNKTDKPVVPAVINSASSLTPTTSSSVAQPPRVDPLQLQQLMDMGFARDHAEEALLQTRGNLATAMDWMFIHPPSSLNQSPTLTEDELLAKAIAMSLEQNTQSKEIKGEGVDGGVATSSDSSRGVLSPLNETTLTSFSEDLLDHMLGVIPCIRDTVYQTCDLMVSLIKRNGPVWRDKAITAVKEKVLLTIVELSGKVSDGSYTIRGGVLDPDAFYICLMALLMEELPLSCGPVVCQADLLQAYVNLLALTQQKLPTMKREQESRMNPMWVAPLLLTLELWLGIEGLATWNRPLAKDHQAVWMWFENTNGRWCCYTPDLARAIDNSYREGETSVRITSGRQRYTIQFTAMTQVNVDSGTQRPVMRLEVPKKKEGKQDGKETKDSTEEPVSFDVPSWFYRFSEEQAVSVVTYCTRLLSTEVEPDTLHANMRLLLSLTKNPKLAGVFMAERGPHALLVLTQHSSFHGFSSLSSLLLRHVLEDDSLLEQCMDSIIRGVIVGGLSDSKEFKVHGPGRRDFDFVLRKLAPCACRDRDLFIKTAADTLRLANEPPPLSDYLNASRVQPVMLKYVPLDKKEHAELSPVQSGLLTLLIDHLCTDAFIEDGLAIQDSTPAGKIDDDTSDGTVLGLRYSLQGSQVRRGSYRRQVTDNDDDDEMRSEDMVLDMEPILEARQIRRNVSRPEPTLEETIRSLTETDEDRARNAEKARAMLPLFSQAAILRLLAEIIESYPVCAKTIIESNREIQIKTKSNTKVSKVVSILAFILDYLLPASYTQGASATQVAKLAKVFLHSLASTTLPNDALVLFVSEFRAAFSRALALPESLVKHQRIRALAGLLGQIVEPQTQTGFSSRSAVNPSQFVRMLIRKGFITDLSKAVHSLDLSSSLLIITINSILKPLECLTKIVTQFLAAQKKDQAAAASTANPPPPPPPLPNPVPLQAQQATGSGNNQGESSSTTTMSRGNVVETTDGSASGTGSSQTNDLQPNTDQSGNDTTLDAGDVSLIPLVEEDQIGTGRELDHDNEDMHELIVHEAMSIAQNLARRAAATETLNHGDEDSNNDEMDIQEIVDELLDQSPRGSGIGPHALMDEDGQPDVTVSGSDLSDGSEEDNLDADNYNSAGEEIDEEDFDDSQNEGFPPRGDHDNDQDDIEDTSESQTSTEIVDEEEEDNPSDNEEEYPPSGDEEEEEEEEDDSMILEESGRGGGGEEEERGGGANERAGEEERDETFEIEADEEDGDDDDDDDEEEEGLELDYQDLDMMEHDDYIHIDMPSLGFGLRDFDSMEAHHYLGGFPSLLSRAYHIRTGNSMEGALPTAVSTLPQHHPLLMRCADHTRHVPAPDHTSSSTGRGGTPADIQRSNIVQQLLTNISTSVGTEEILSFNVGGSNPRQSNTVRVPDPNDNSFMTGRSEDSTESTTVPSNLSRWREESSALDGPTAFLCVAGIRSTLLNMLIKHFAKQQAIKKSNEKMGKDVSSSSGKKSQTQPPPISAPNPSDETTPSTATPGNSSTSVEQLRSSLRAVADALSQMGGNPRPLESSETSSQEESILETREGVRMEDSSSGSVVTTSESHPVDQSRTMPSRLVDTMPDLSMFDGSQDSARAILTRISPDDPLYTFLSAVARAPTPPLPETTPTSASLSPSRVTLPSVPPVSILPHQSTVPSSNSLQVSVIQDPRPFDQPHSHSQSQPQSHSFPPVSISSVEVSNLANRVTTFIMNQQYPGSQSSHPHSQSLEPVPIQGSLAASNFADLLATELGQAISDHLVPISTPSVTSSSTSSVSLPSSAFVTVTSSPSPSDTLAPLLSSLQMPNQQPHLPQETGVQQGEPQTSRTDSETGQTCSTTEVSQNTISVVTTSASSSDNQTTTASSTPQTSQASQSISQTGLTGNTSSHSSEFPEGIDPTFLAALPDSIRQEVLAQYERDQRQQQQQQNRSAPNEASSSSVTSTTASTAAGGEINPEVLAALPPDIQEEVLQQQRLEEARRMSTDPAHQGDATSFLSSLTPDLRRTILSDMDDTQIAQLPEDIAAEARSLRQEREARSRQLLALQQARYEQQLLDTPQWTHSITHSHPIGLNPGTRYQGYAMFGLTHDRGLHDRFGLFPPMSHSFLMQRSSGGDLTGKQILDQEGLACLLALLFLDQSKIHFNRLFRIFRSLSQHIPSRSWLIASLLLILKKTNSHTCPHPGEQANQSHWLNMTINAALGSHVSVFQFAHQHSGKVPLSDVYIHPHATAPICNNVLELMIFLARQFPSSFLPADLIPKDKQQQLQLNQQPEVLSNFWQILFKLDSSPRKGKGSAKAFQHSDPLPGRSESDLFSFSPIGLLMRLFDHPVIQSSVNLVDKLLRVLSVISGAITKQGLTRTTATSKDKDEMSTDHQTPSGATAVEPKGLEISESPLHPTQPPSCYSSSVVSVSLLHSVINLLTSGKCTEDCLDDATNLLINLSRCSSATREAILLVLLEGVQKIGRVLSSQISVLLSELADKMSALSSGAQSSQEELDKETQSSGSTSNQANGLPSLGTTEGVILPTLQGRGVVTDHSQDLHLSCMEPLICKGSQQSFFLRLLKVVCQLRESSQPVIVQGTRRGDSASVPFLLSQSPLLSTSGLSSSTPQQQQLADTPSSTQEEGDPLPAAGSGSKPAANTSSTTTLEDTAKESPYATSLSSQLELEELWISLSDCLDALANTYDPHAVLVLQPTVEAFFLVHADQSEEARTTVRDKRTSRGRRLPSFHTISDTESNVGSPAPYDTFSPASFTPGVTEVEASDPYAHLPPDTARFLKFAERHRTVLNQILRQSTIPLSEGPFAVLVNHTRLLDFDVKRRYFRQELEQLDEGLRRDDLVIHVRRDHVFEDSYRELYRRSTEDLKANLYVTFEGEEGQDAGGLLREWYLIIAREMFNPNYALFKTTPGDRVTYMPNPSSHINPEHLSYFKFVGRIIAKAIYDNKLLDCYFTRSFYKHILGKPVHYTDMESEDYAFYQGMVYLLEHDLNDMGMELTFSTDIEEFGKTESRDLKPKGHELQVAEGNKREYVQLACQMKMTGSIRSQIKSFLEGFYEVIPKNLISIFNEQELELLISGLPNFDIDDLKANTEYHKYTESSLQIQWFWRALRSYSQADRARFLQFVTGTSKVPLQGFVALEGMNGIQKFQIHRDDRSTERLPSAHTCFNHLDLPPYETYDKLNQMLLTAVRECPEGFGFA